jgi:gas vesicle protein
VIKSVVMRKGLPEYWKAFSLLEGGINATNRQLTVSDGRESKIERKSDERQNPEGSKTMSTWKFWAAFGVGVAAGAALALIYAPQSGARTRRQIKRTVSEAGEYIKDTADTVSDAANKYLKRSKDVMGDVVDSAQNVVTAAKRVTSFG